MFGAGTETNFESFFKANQLRDYFQQTTFFTVLKEHCKSWMEFEPSKKLNMKICVCFEFQNFEFFSLYNIIMLWLRHYVLFSNVMCIALQAVPRLWTVQLISSADSKKKFIWTVLLKCEPSPSSHMEAAQCFCLHGDFGDFYFCNGCEAQVIKW